MSSASSTTTRGTLTLKDPGALHQHLRDTIDSFKEDSYAAKITQAMATRTDQGQWCLPPIKSLERDVSPVPATYREDESEEEHPVSVGIVLLPCSTSAERSHLSEIDSTRQVKYRRDRLLHDIRGLRDGLKDALAHDQFSVEEFELPKGWINDDEKFLCISSIKDMKSLTSFIVCRLPAPLQMENFSNKVFLLLKKPDTAVSDKASSGDTITFELEFQSPQ